MPGIYRTQTGFRAIAQIGRGKRMEKAFPKGTAPRTMVRWQEQARRELRDRPVVKDGSLEADLQVYMKAKVAMSTKDQRERHLRLWFAALGGQRHRNTVTALEVQTQREQWLAAGTHSKITINHWRTALLNFYTVLNGKAGYNPVRAVKKFKVKAKPRKPFSYAILEAIIAKFPTTWRGYGRRPDARMHRQMVARLRLLAYVGLPHTQIKALVPAHLIADPDAKGKWLLLIRGRDKGDGTADVYMPLGARGLAAVQDFFACRAEGDFRNETLRDLFQAGAAQIGRLDLTPYDARSLYAKTVLRSAKNRAALKDLMQHESEETSEIYAQEALRDELRAALEKFDADVLDFRVGNGPTTAPPSDANVPPVIH